MCVRICWSCSRAPDLKFSQTGFRCLGLWWVGIVLRSGYIALQRNNSASVMSIVAVVFVTDDQNLAQVSSLPEVSRTDVSRRYRMSSSARSMDGTCIFFQYPVESHKQSS